MKLIGVNPDSSNREKLDVAIRVPIKLALQGEAVSVDEVCFLLTRMLSELADGGIVAGHLMAAYELAAKRNKKPALTCEDIQKLVTVEKILTRPDQQQHRKCC